MYPKIQSIDLLIALETSILFYFQIMANLREIRKKMDGFPEAKPLTKLYAVFMTGYNPRAPTCEYKGFQEPIMSSALYFDPVLAMIDSSVQHNRLVAENKELVQRQIYTVPVEVYSPLCRGGAVSIITRWRADMETGHSFEGNSIRVLVSYAPREKNEMEYWRFFVDLEFEAMILGFRNDNQDETIDQRCSAEMVSMKMNIFDKLQTMEQYGIFLKGFECKLVRNMLPM